MLLTTESNVISSSGLQQTSMFQIAVSAHAFRMLSSGAYSDKIGAVLREIGCNAMDAHIAAGKPELPFEIHLPNKLSSKFYIKDFGPGLSPEEIQSLYTTYFSSSKQQSNDFTGAFGLGSKSPFAYTDSFTVISTHGGVKTTYAAYVGEAGVPVISKVYEAPADEDWPSGLMVSMPVHPNDYLEFTKKAQEIFSWFRVTPKVVNAEQIKPRTFAIKTEYFGLEAEEVPDYYTEHRISVLMGNVRYKVNIDDWAAAVPSEVQWVLSLRPVFFFPIGAVDVAVSREALEFTAKTRQALKKASQHLADHIVGLVRKELEALDLSTWSGIRDALPKISKIMYGWPSASLRSRLEGAGMDADHLDIIFHLHYNTNPRMFLPPDFNEGLIEFRANNKGGVTTTKHPPTTQAKCLRVLNSRILDENAAIVIPGKTRYLRDRIRNELLNGSYRHLYILPGKDDAEIAQIAKKLFDFPTVKGEDLELPAGWVPPKKRPKQPKSPKPPPTLRMVYCNPDGSISCDAEYPLDKVVDDNKKFYVTTSMAWGNRKWHFGDRSYGDWQPYASHLLALSPYLSEAPQGMALVTRGEAEKLQLDEKGWQPIGALRRVLESSAVRDKVNTFAERSIPTVSSTDSWCNEYESPLMFFAAHAKANTSFWQHLTAIPIMTKCHLLNEANKVASGTAVLNTQKTIPGNVYNTALSTLGSYRTLAVTYVPDPMKTLYPAFDRALNYSFPNSLIAHDPKLAAAVVAAILAHDDVKIPSLT